MKTCEAIDMPASPAAQHSVVMCGYARQHIPFVFQGRLSLMITSVSFEKKKKVLPKVTVTSVINLDVFYCEVVHLSTLEITCNAQAGILVEG